MEMRESADGDVLVLSPEGSLVDAEDTRAIEARLAVALKAKTGHIVLDCDAVAHVSSEVIRVLLMTMHKLDHLQGRLVLCGLNARVLHAFAISGFDKDFTVVSNLEAALVRVQEPLERHPVRRAPMVLDAGDAASAAPAEPVASLATVDYDRLAAELLERLAGATPMLRPAGPAPADADTLAVAILGALGAGRSVAQGN